MGGMKTSLWQRFWSKVSVQADGCWLWTGSRFSNGYSYFHLSCNPRKVALGHKWCYERMVGSVPEGLELDHKCRVRHCVNPAHLEPVTHSTNMRRSPLVGKGLRRKTHCKRGHPLSGDNLAVYGETRHCIQCKTQHKREARAKIKDDPEALKGYRAKDAERAREYRKRKRGGVESVPNSEKTHCKNGHPYQGTNLVINSKGGRRCRICINEANHRAYLKRTGR